MAKYNIYYVANVHRYLHHRVLLYDLHERDKKRLIIIVRWVGKR